MSTSDNNAKIRKATGSHYTPTGLSGFVAKNIYDHMSKSIKQEPLRVLDPAIGDGELLASILIHFSNNNTPIQAYGFDTNLDALNTARKRLRARFPHIEQDFRQEDFIEHVLTYNRVSGQLDLFDTPKPEKYDIVIANPPYVRTQVLGAAQSKQLSRSFNFSGRVDLYFAFIEAISRITKPGGVVGIITSNRFMTTKSGANVRRILSEQFNLLHIWDLGDTKLFDAAVLPVVLLMEKKSNDEVTNTHLTCFTSIYTIPIADPGATTHCTNVFEALECQGIVSINRKQQFMVRQGQLQLEKDFNRVWRISATSTDNWLDQVHENTFCTFGDIDKVRVGVKTTADKVFIRSDWDSFPKEEIPELLHSLTTHHIAQQYRATKPSRYILYTHEIANGKRRVVDLKQYPKSERYLEKHRTTLENRDYVKRAGRQWFEIWVPQNPSLWSQPKLVFRDIVDKPTFWLDMEGTIINGDCYWLTTKGNNQADFLWLALAIGNSSFIEYYYDRMFNNKLYAGRRRFMTQYVEKFPIPNPESDISKQIIEDTKQAYELTPSTKAKRLITHIDELVWQVFGVSDKEVVG